MPLLNVYDEIFNCFNFREELKIGCMKITVEILSQDSRSMIAEKDTIRVHHRNDIEVEMISENSQFENFSHEGLHCEVGDSFPWMGPC
jgi:hypothetical protein